MSGLTMMTSALSDAVTGGLRPAKGFPVTGLTGTALTVAVSTTSLRRGCRCTCSATSRRRRGRRRCCRGVGAAHDRGAGGRGRGSSRVLEGDVLQRGVPGVGDVVGVVGGTARGDRRGVRAVDLLDDRDRGVEDGDVVGGVIGDRIPDRRRAGGGRRVGDDLAGPESVDAPAAIWWSQVNFQASSRSSRLSPLRSPTLRARRRDGSPLVAHLSSVTWTLDSGVLPVLVTV